MPETKHTPGPWRWFGNTKSHDIHLATVNGGRVFVLNFVRWGMAGAQPRFQGRGERRGFMVPATDLVTYEVDYRRDISGINHPDAHLIAAAPELLRALKGALYDSGCDGDLCMHEWHELARAAIAKAEGRSDG